MDKPSSVMSRCALAQRQLNPSLIRPSAGRKHCGRYERNQSHALGGIRTRSQRSTVPVLITLNMTHLAYRRVSGSTALPSQIARRCFPRPLAVRRSLPKACFGFCLPARFLLLPKPASFLGNWRRRLPSHILLRTWLIRKPLWTCSTT